MGWRLVLFGVFVLVVYVVVTLFIRGSACVHATIPLSTSNIQITTITNSRTRAMRWKLMIFFDPPLLFAVCWTVVSSRAVDVNSAIMEYVRTAQNNNLNCPNCREQLP
jgi:hypothetical protein